MRPQHDARRTVIREWMALPRQKRETKEQTADFAAKAAKSHEFVCKGDRYARIMTWLLPRTAKP